MNYHSKTFRNNNYFILYTQDDQIICYFDNFEELSKHLNYRLSNLVNLYNIHKSNIINIEIDNKRLKLATFC